VLSAPCSPWQSSYVERLIGSIRRECLDHIMVFGERHLNRILRSYVAYYHHWRTHLSLEMGCPEPRPIQPSTLGPVRTVLEVGSLHHPASPLRTVGSMRIGETCVLVLGLSSLGL
jgi:putative transposase